MRLALIALLFFLSLAPATAQDSTAAAGRYSIGLQSSWPTYGLSLQYHLNPKVTAEAVLGRSGTLTNVGGRVLYRYRRSDTNDVYGYGGVGLWRYSYSLAELNETAVGGSVGIGAEAFLEQILGAEGEPFLPITLSAEIGLAFVQFENYNGFSALSYGGGVHYRF